MYAGEVYAVSNKCTHLGLPLQGKIVGKEVTNGCIVCPFHNNAFDVKTGEVQGEWAPGVPTYRCHTDVKTDQGPDIDHVSV